MNDFARLGDLDAQLIANVLLDEASAAIERATIKSPNFHTEMATARILQAFVRAINDAVRTQLEIERIKLDEANPPAPTCGP